MPSIRPSLFMCVALAAASPALAGTPPVSAADIAAHRIVVMRFAAAGDASARSGSPSARACPAAAAPVNLDPAILEAVTASLQRRLSKSMTTSVGTGAAAVPSGALALAGCITRADAGDAKKRMVGAYVGASHLDAHVQLLSKKGAALKPLKAFDIKVRGGNLLPPLSPVGLASNVATMSSKTLKADAPRLAYQIDRKVFAAVYPGRDYDFDDDDE